MPRPRAAAVSSPQDRKKTVRLPQGWRTTDEDEVQRRRQRAASEPLAVEALEAGHPVFGTFRVSSETGSAYEVEIRSLYEHNNSCGCPDYEVNGLGTCKHVEAVLARVRGSRKTRLSPRRIEVFLRRTGEQPEVRAQMLERSGGSAANALIARYFTDQGALRGNPLNRLPDLARALAAAPPRVREEIRLSRHLLPWLEQERRKAARQTATFAQAERKLRMATLLAGGGFPIEALPALREAVETALQARAQMEGLDHLPTALPLLDKLRADPGALLGATEEEARSWIAGAEGLVAEIEKEVRLEAHS